MAETKRPRALINGFGRIGRLALRRSLGFGGVDLAAFHVVAVNDPLAVAESAAYLLEFDSTIGKFGSTTVAEDGESFSIKTAGEKEATFKFTRAKTPAEVPLEGIDLVLECSGKFLTRAALQPFFDNGAKAVVVSAPIDDKEKPVLNCVYGVNHEEYANSDDAIVTAASCTTNCLAPLVKVVLENFGIERGCITTIHDVTNTQTVVDALNTKKSDLRRARSSLCNLAPTSTGSAKAIALVFPQLQGKLNGLAIRVPLLNASITDAVFQVSRATTAEEVNAALRAASEEGSLKGLLGFETRPLVSSDYVLDDRSAIVDAACTQVIDGTLVKIYAWYQNELGYACRYVDVAGMVAKKKCV